MARTRRTTTTPGSGVRGTEAFAKFFEEAAGDARRWDGRWARRVNGPRVPGW